MADIPASGDGSVRALVEVDCRDFPHETDGIATVGKTSVNDAAKRIQFFQGLLDFRRGGVLLDQAELRR